MLDHGYMVSEKENAESLHSASYGADKAFSRKQAKEIFTHSDLKELFNQQHVTLIEAKQKRHQWHTKCVKR
ncbi:RtcB family protein [Halosquirtibacter xylanolyticus]|uniref:hypothetical protein n=1 Tax=Halosquirtibacter xylanolyticus TaxID=3374599 RepID=UPI0037487BCC|nr:RtcB family protein [Prolixibacteraceae bacterium]